MEFNDYLENLKSEEKTFLQKFNPKQNTVNITSFDTFKLQLKFENSDEKNYYFKCNASKNDFADYGEAITSIIANFVGINAVKTHLVESSNEFGVVTENFVNPTNNYLSLSNILSSFNEAHMRTFNNVVAAVKFYCEDNDIICDESVERDLKRLVLLDYLLLQQDRHGGNIEFEISKNSKGDSVLKLAPIFDNEFCFLFVYDEAVWDNYKKNENEYLYQIFSFSKDNPINSLAKEVIKSDDLTNILEKYMKVDINKIIDFCDEITTKKMPKKYRKVVVSIFETQKEKLFSEIKNLSIKKVFQNKEEYESAIIL